MDDIQKLESQEEVIAEKDLKKSDTKMYRVIEDTAMVDKPRKRRAPRKKPTRRRKKKSFWDLIWE